MTTPDQTDSPKSPSVRVNPRLHVHVFPAAEADKMAEATAHKLHGTEPKDYSYGFFPGVCVQRSVARVVPTTRTDVYLEAVALTVERVKATGELGRDPHASGLDRVAAFNDKGELVESAVRVVEILAN